MVRSQHRSKRKASGGKYKAFRKKKQFETGNVASFTKLGPKKARIKRVLGNNTKKVLLEWDEANITDPKTKKS